MTTTYRGSRTDPGPFGGLDGMATDHEAAHQRVSISAAPHRVRTAGQGYPRRQRADPRTRKIVAGRRAARDHPAGWMCGAGRPAPPTSVGERADRDGEAVGCALRPNRRNTASGAEPGLGQVDHESKRRPAAGG